MEELILLLEQLALQMNTTVEFLWEVMVRQAKIEFMKGIVYWVLWLVLIFIVVRKFDLGEMLSIENSDNLNAIMATFLIAFMIVGFILNLVNLNSMLDALLNPEYWALQQILEYVK